MDGHPMPPSLVDAAKYFLKLGSLGFGGPIALVGAMQRDLVEERKWFSLEDFREGLALAQLAPGPLAAQLAIYLGWLISGVLGATVVAFAFVLPSFLMVLALSWAYVRYDGLDWMAGAFFGVGAAVIGIIVRSTYKLLKSTLAKDKLLWAIFGISAVVTAVTESENLWLFLAAGVVTMFVRARPTKLPKMSAAPVLTPIWLFAGLKGPAEVATLWKLTTFFTVAGAFVFGSGLAIVPFLHGGVVNDYHWLNERQFLDAVAVAMITPGPVVITVGFIGYLVAGPAGAALAALGVFLPCYLFVVIPAKHFRRWSENGSVRAAVNGITAAATGAIAGSAFVLAERAIRDWISGAIALASLLILIYTKKVPEPVLILGAAIIGVATVRFAH